MDVGLEQRPRSTLAPHASGASLELLPAPPPSAFPNSERYTGLIVAMEARHLIMEMRGVATPGITTTTPAIRGALEDEGLQGRFFARRPAASVRPSVEEP